MHSDTDTGGRAEPGRLALRKIAATASAAHAENQTDGLRRVTVASLPSMMLNSLSIVLLAPTTLISMDFVLLRLLLVLGSLGPLLPLRILCRTSQIVASVVWLHGSGSLYSLSGCEGGYPWVLLVSVLPPPSCLSTLCAACCCAWVYDHVCAVHGLD